MQPVFLRQGLEQGVLLYVHYTHVQEATRAGHIRNVFYAAVSFRKLLMLLILRSNLHCHMFAGINRLPFVDRFSRNPGTVWVKMGKWESPTALSRAFSTMQVRYSFGATPVSKKYHISTFVHRISSLPTDHYIL